jgi:hypothetical protein
MAKKFGLRLQEIPTEFVVRVVRNIEMFRPEPWEDLVIANIHLCEAFPWLLTEEGHEFWFKVASGEVIDKDALLDAISEAKSRGLKDGCWTEHGQVLKENPITGEKFEHELLFDGTFYFRNIKARDEEGNWVNLTGKGKGKKTSNTPNTHVGSEQEFMDELTRLLKNMLN